MPQHQTTTRRQSTVTRQRATPAAGRAPDPDERPPRRLRLGRYRSFRIERKSLAPAAEDRGLPSGGRILRVSLRLVRRQWRLFGSIMLLYALIHLILAGGFTDSTSIDSARANINQQLGDDGGVLATGFAVLGLLFTSGGTNSLNEAAGAYQVVLFFLASLSLIWAARQTSAGGEPSLQAALYKGPAAITPFLLVLLVLIVELVPFAAGAYAFATLVGGGIAVTFLERALVVMLVGLLTIVSLYWLIASIFAGLIVTLRDMTPLKALKSANELVRFRRFPVLRKIAYFGLVVALVLIFVVVPVGLTYSAAAPVVFFVALMVIMPVTYVYLYTLYRELIG